ncbi:Hypothetical protein, putative [Bodo saltans]|uniref:Uncharacterized protein n=1 Tax=Bodo saltans TaxID=75058 RepID=A0A0S4J3H8_BODSA|nr:Hypothetical protein, putative [Bodo saltans]|eukprot:CUG68440.1 Hypothetical protein, putative [Bodo saltans]
MPPVEVTVHFEGSGSVIAFDVMPSFDQLVYCIRCDIVKRGHFELHSRTLRGAALLLKDQHALNRVSSDGSSFSVEVLRTDSPGRGVGVGLRSSPGQRHAATSSGGSPRAASPLQKKPQSGGILSPLQGGHPSSVNFLEMLQDRTVSFSSGVPVGASSTSPLRGSRMFAPIQMSTGMKKKKRRAALEPLLLLRRSPSQEASCPPCKGAIRPQSISLICYKIALYPSAVASLWGPLVHRPFAAVECSLPFKCLQAMNGVVASTLARAASASRMSPSRAASTNDLLGSTVTSEYVADTKPSGMSSSSAASSPQHRASAERIPSRHASPTHRGGAHNDVTTKYVDAAGSALNRSPSSSDTHSTTYIQHRASSHTSSGHVYVDSDQLQRALNAPAKPSPTKAAAPKNSGVIPLDIAVSTEDSNVVRLSDVIPVNEVIQAAEVTNDGAVVWHSDGSHAALIVRDAATGDMIARVTTTSVSSTVHTTCTSLCAVGADAMWAGFTDGTVVVFHSVTYKEAALLRGHRGSVTCIAVSSSGTFVFTGSEDGLIRQYDAAFASLHNVLQQSSGDVRGAVDRGAILALAAVDVPRLDQHHPHAFSTWVFAGTSSRLLQLWTAEHSEVSVEVCDAHEGALRALAVEPQLRSSSTGRSVRVWTGSNDGRIRVWDAKQKNVRHATDIDFGAASPEMTFVTEFSTHKAPVICLRALEGRMLALSDDQTLSVYTLTPPSPRGHNAKKHEGGEDEDADPVFLTQVANGSRVSAYSCIALGPVQMLRSVWCCGGLDRTVSIWSVPDMTSSTTFSHPFPSSTVANGIGRSQGAAVGGLPTLASSLADSSYLGDREVQLTRIMRSRVMQRALGDCVSEEETQRYILHVEHERDLFRLLSLSDTVIRQRYSVTTDAYVGDLTTTALVAHAQMGLAWLALYEDVMLRMHSMVRSFARSSSLANGNTQRLMHNFRHLQEDLEKKIEERSAMLEDQKTSYASLRVAHEAALARGMILEADVSDLTIMKDTLTTSAFSLEKSLKAAEEAVTDLKRREVLHLQERQELERRLSEAERRDVEHSRNLDGAGNDLSAARRDEREARRECAALEHRVGQLEARLKSQEQRAQEDEATWTRRLDDLRRKMLDAADEAEKELRSSKEHSRQQIELSREETRSLESKLREQQRMMDQLTTRSTLSQEQHKALQQQLDDNKRGMEESSASAHRRWQEDVARLEATVLERSSKNEQLRSQIHSLEAQHERSHMQTSTLQRLVEQLRSEKEAVEQRLQTVIDASRTSAQQQSQILPNTVARLKNELLVLQDSLTEERSRRLQQEQLLAAAEEHYELVQRQSVDDIATAKAISNKELNVRIRREEELRSQAEVLSTANASLTAQVRALETRVEDLNTATRSHAQLHDEAARLRVEILTSSQRVDELKGRLHDAEQHHRAALESTTAEFLLTLQTMRDQLHQKSELLVQLEMKKRSLEATVDRNAFEMAEFSTRIQQVTHENAYVMESKALLQEQLHGTAQLLSNSEHQKRALEAQVERQTIELRDANGGNQSLIDELAHVTATVQALRSEKDRRGADLDTHHHQKLEAQQSAKRILDLEHALRQANDIITSSANQLHAQDAEIQNLRTAHDTLRSTHERYLQESEDERCALRERLEREESERRLLETGARGATARVRDLEQQRHHSEERLRSESHFEGQSLLDQLSAAHDRCSVLTNELTELEAAATRSSGTIAHLQFELEAKDKELAALLINHQELEASRSAVAALPSVQREVISLQRRLDDAHLREDHLKLELEEFSRLTQETSAIAQQALEKEVRELGQQITELKHREVSATSAHAHQLLSLEQRIRSANLEILELQEEHNRTTALLEEAQHALVQAAAPPSPLSSAASSPKTGGGHFADRQQGALSAILQQALLMQQQRDACLLYWNTILAPYVEERSRFLVLSFSHLAQRAQDQLSVTRRTHAITEEQQRSSLVDLAKQRDALAGTHEQRQQLIAEVQTELRELYTRYRNETDAHKRTKQQLSDVTETLVPETNRLKHTIAMYERELALRSLEEPLTPLHADSFATTQQSSPGDQAARARQREGICELLEGIQDAVDLLQPVSLGASSSLGEHTLVALYEWLVSAQMRCEALALACEK